MSEPITIKLQSDGISILFYRGAEHPMVPEGESLKELTELLQRELTQLQHTMSDRANELRVERPNDWLLTKFIHGKFGIPVSLQ